jgi:hypothetical protein
MSSPYYPGAVSWQVRAARAALPAARYPDAAAMPREGFGVNLFPGDRPGQVSVQLLLATYRTVHHWRPRAGSEDERVWCVAREDIAGLLALAGFRGFAFTQAGLDATAPPAVTPTVVHLTSARAEGVYQVTAPAHPHLVGRIDGAARHGGGYIVYGSEQDIVPMATGVRSLEEAAQRWGLLCGLPEPVTVGLIPCHRPQ